VQLIISYDKLAEKHRSKVDFLQIFQRLKEAFESSFLTVEFFFRTENSRGFASTEVLNFLPPYQFCKYVLDSPTLFRSQLKSKKRWEIQIPCAKSQKSLFLKKPGQYLAQSARYCRRRHHHAGSRSRPFLAVAAQCWHSSFKDDRFGT